MRYGKALSRISLTQNDALETLLKEDTPKLVKQLYDEVHNVRKAIEEFAEMLNR